MKRPNWFEIYFLPNFPDGEDETSMECKQKELAKETKRHPTASLITKIMDSDFLEDKNMEPPVEDTMKRWPALFTECQVISKSSYILCIRFFIRCIIALASKYLTQSPSSMLFFHVGPV